MRNAIAAALCLLAALLTVGCTPTGNTGNTASAECDPHGISMFQPASCRPYTEHRGDTGHDTSGNKPGCDPHGFGPLSGCGSSGNRQVSAEDDSSGSPLPKSYFFRARHEAGHKVCAQELGMSVNSVSLRSDGEGRTNIAGFRFKDPQQRLIVLYCGEIAAGTSEGTEGESSDGNPGDHDQEAAIIANFPVDSGAAWSEAKRIVSKRSSRIDRDAKRLLKQGYL